MRLAGVNVFPAEDAFKYVKISDKVWALLLFTVHSDWSVSNVTSFCYVISDCCNCLLVEPDDDQASEWLYLYACQSYIEIIKLNCETVNCDTDSHVISVSPATIEHQNI